MKAFAEFGIDVPPGVGGNVKVRCPRCSDERRKRRDPCLSVDVDQGIWNCHHCGWSGSLREPRRREYRRPAPLPKRDPDADVLAWFAKRGISETTVRRNRITAANVYFPQLDGEAKAIAFPYYRGDELVNVKFRALREKAFTQSQGAEPILYGADNIGDVLVVVEGEIDALSVQEAGITTVVSVPNGAPAPGTKNYSSKFDFLADDRLATVRDFVLATDGDAPGETLAAELARRFGPGICRRVSWPENTKDANDVLTLYGPARLREVIEQAKPLPIEGVLTVEELSAEIDRLFTDGLPRGESTGWPAFDQFYRVRPGLLTVLTGIPGAGKSNFLDALCVNLARDSGWRFAFFSPENQPVERHIAALAEKVVGKPFGHGPNPRMTAEQLNDAKDFIGEHFRWILPDDDAEWTVDTVLNLARELVLRDGIRGLIIDPWNELESGRPPQMTETEFVSAQLKKIRQFARRHGVHVWIVAHPQKLRRDFRDDDEREPVPTLYDISGSAHWRNKADMGLVIYRGSTAPSGSVRVFIAKVRFREDGRLGSCDFFFDPVNGRFTPHDDVPNKLQTTR